MLKHWQATKRRSMLSLDEGKVENNMTKTSPEIINGNATKEHSPRGGTKEAIRRRKPNQVRGRRPKSSADIEGFNRSMYNKDSMNDTYGTRMRQQIISENVSHPIYCVENWTNSEVLEWIETFYERDEFEYIGSQIRTLNITGKQLSDTETARKVLDNINFRTARQKQIFLHYLLDLLNNEERSKNQREESYSQWNSQGRSKSDKTRRFEAVERGTIFVESNSLTRTTKVANNVKLREAVIKREILTEDSKQEHEENIMDNESLNSTSMISSPNLSRSADSLVTSSSDYVSGSSSTTSASTSICVDNGETRSYTSTDVKGDVKPTENIRSNFSSSSPASSTVWSSKTSKMRRRFQQLRGKVSSGGEKKNNQNDIPPSNLTIPLPGLQPIVVFSDLSGSGEFASFELHVTATTSCFEILQIFLDCQGIIDDVKLHSLHQISMKTNDAEGKSEIFISRQLNGSECPYVIMQNASRLYPKNVRTRLEIQKEKGIPIQVSCRVGSHRPWRKLISVNLESTSGEVLRLVLKKSGLRNINYSAFALFELKPKEDYELPEGMRISWRSNVTYLITDRNSQQCNDMGSPNHHELRSCSSSSSGKSSLSDISAKSSESWPVTSRSPVRRRPSLKVVDGVSTYEVSDGISESCNQIVHTNNESQKRNTDVKRTNKPQQVEKSKMIATKKYSRDRSELEKNEMHVLDNAVLRAQLRQQDERTILLYRRIGEIRKMLESAIQSENENRSHCSDIPSVMEAKMRSLEQEVTDTESILSQLFSHQRKSLLKSSELNGSRYQDGLSALLNAQEILSSNGRCCNIETLAEVEMKIALHQANLLYLKHHLNTLEMQMSLLVSQRKEEQFRQMCTGSLYEILSRSRQIYITSCNPTPEQSSVVFQKSKSNGDPRFLIYHCEIHSGKAGYGLCLIQERFQGIDSGIIVDTPHIQGRLKKGDQIIEVNGVNVQSTTTDFVARLLKGTKTAHIVALRQKEESSDGGKTLANISVLLDKCKLETEVADCESKQETKDEFMLKSDEIQEILTHDCNHRETAVGSAENADIQEFNALQCDLERTMKHLKTSEESKKEMDALNNKQQKREELLQFENRCLRNKIVEMENRQQIDEKDKC